MSSAMNPSTTHEFEIKRGDTGPVLETVLIDGDGRPVDLTSAISVGLTMTLATNPRTPVLVAAACGFAPDTSGAVSYAWSAANTAVVGLYDIEWTVIWPANLVMTFPSRGFDKVRVNARA